MSFLFFFFFFETVKEQDYGNGNLIPQIVTLKLNKILNPYLVHLYINFIKIN